MTEKATMGVVLQMVAQNRDDCRDMEKRVMALERAYTDTALEFTRINTAAKAPVDILRIGMSLKLGASIVAAVATILTGAWGAAAWVKSDFWAMNYQLQDLKQQQQMVRTKVEGLERSVATLMGRSERIEQEKK